MSDFLAAGQGVVLRLPSPKSAPWRALLNDRVLWSAFRDHVLVGLARL